ncbi:MAG: 4'-phosphopantetheinyl transferase superfamily protein [Thermodesulfovibrionales bacterium]|nr:4'-phosphopantetheinyl transferase superfamily protein [Thermodesulfovibrionales bacterium]
MDVIKDYQEITVKVISFPHQRGTVLYACLPCEIETITGHRTSGAEDKHRLASILWEHLVGMEASACTDCRFSNRADLPIQVVHNPLGRPQLLLAECEGPAISFSEGGGKIWAALCGDGSEIGIDVAVTDEFHGEYPFHRVFHPQELQHALRLADGDLEKASALLWSVKEAAVKALGCAFHLVDPQQIYIYPSPAEKDGWDTFIVCLSGKALVRFPLMTGRCILVRSLALRKMWISIALLNWQHQCGNE